MLPDGATDAASLVTQAMAIIQKISTDNADSSLENATSSLDELSLPKVPRGK